MPPSGSHSEPVQKVAVVRYMTRSVTSSGSAARGMAYASSLPWSFPPQWNAAGTDPPQMDMNFAILPGFGAAGAERAKRIQKPKIGPMYPLTRR